MTRQRLLIWLLVALAAIGLPVYYMDAALAGSRNRLDAELLALAPLRRQAAAVRELAEAVAARTGRMEAVGDRLIAGQPFAAIESELAKAARESGVRLGALVLEGPAAVAELPALQRYQATVSVSGDRNQFLAFLRLLEAHRLLIEVPEVSLQMQAQPARGVVPQVQQVLELGFFAAGPVTKPQEEGQR